MTTIEQLKSKYRVYQKGDKYYIQKKTFLGWSHLNDFNNDFSGFVAWLYILSYIFISFNTIFILFFIKILISDSIFLKEIAYLIFIDVIFLIIAFIITSFTKYFCNVYNSLFIAENRIDYKCSNELKKIEKNLIEKNVKYHYFYSKNQIRKQKLKKIS